MENKLIITEDGFERTMQVNFLSAVLLCKLLSQRNKLLNVINVSSDGVQTANPEFDNLFFNKKGGKWPGRYEVYSCSKLATYLHCRKVYGNNINEQTNVTHVNPGWNFL